VNQEGCWDGYGYTGKYYGDMTYMLHRFDMKPMNVWQCFFVGDIKATYLVTEVA
jgi:hypothetical protein